MHGIARRRLIVALPGLMGLLVVACGGGDGGPAAPALTSAMVLARGPAGIGVTTMQFEDTSRPTMANGAVPGLPSRVLDTEIWYPTAPSAMASDDEQRDAPFARDGQRHPLIIYSHGFMDTRTGGTYLARHLASHGYIVAAPDFPLTNLFTAGGANLLDVVNQPDDVRFLIDQMLALDADPASNFAGTIDPHRIGLSGLSLGGTTTLLTAFHPTLRDPRVRAVAPIAGSGCFFGANFYANAHVPLLLLQGTIDALVPYQQNAVFAFGQARAPKYLVAILNGSHTGFTNSATLLFPNLPNPDDVGCAEVGGGHVGDSGATVRALLGGAAAGLIMGDCPAACSDPLPRPRAMRPQRQHDLAVLTVAPFFDAYLRDSASARRFLETTLAVENAEVATQFQR